VSGLLAGLLSLSRTDLVKAYAQRAGLDASTFSGHSLRSGFLTSGAEAGASIFKLMEVSRHKSVDTLRGYVRRVGSVPRPCRRDLPVIAISRLLGSRSRPTAALCAEPEDAVLFLQRPNPASAA
jgi:hypothetical protein